MDPVSIQPVRGGPAYVLRNVVRNVPEEQIKLKSLGGTDEPSGALIYHNTFASPKLALNLQTPITQHNFVVQNNLFVGPDTLAGARTVDWTAALDGATFDFNGYYPDGGFWLGSIGGQNQLWGSFAEVQAAGVFEGSGVLLQTPIFAAGFVGPADPMTHEAPGDFALAEGSNAVDKGLLIPGINGSFLGTAPDLGALEQGCPQPVFGPRPEGMEAVTNPIDCSKDSMPPTTTGAGGAGTGGGSSNGGSANGGGAMGGDGAGGGEGGGGGAGGGSGGCGCSIPGGSGPGGAALAFLALSWLAARRRRHGSRARPMDARGRRPRLRRARGPRA
jgi:MYXO-CTERM domain-containing protein